MWDSPSFFDISILAAVLPSSRNDRTSDKLGTLSQIRWFTAMFFTSYLGTVPGPKPAGHEGPGYKLANIIKRLYDNELLQTVKFYLQRGKQCRNMF